MKNNGLKITIVIALILSIAGLSLGFANYASNLKIESSAKYKINVGEKSPWLVAFVGQSELSSGFDSHELPPDSKTERMYAGKIDVGQVVSGYIEPGCRDEYNENEYFDSYYSSQYCEDVEATPAKVDNLTVSEISVSFKNLAASVFYELPVGNYGLVDAYLKSVTFDGEVSCAAANGATISQDKLDAICNNVEVVFNYDDTVTSLNGITSSVSNITTNNKLEAGTAAVTGLYIGLRPSEEALTNITLDKINITIPDITLGFSSVN